MKICLKLTKRDLRNRSLQWVRFEWDISKIEIVVSASSWYFSTGLAGRGDNLALSIRFSESIHNTPNSVQLDPPCPTACYVCGETFPKWSLYYTTSKTPWHCQLRHAVSPWLNIVISKNSFFNEAKKKIRCKDRQTIPRKGKHTGTIVLGTVSIISSHMAASLINRRLYY